MTLEKGQILVDQCGPKIGDASEGVRQNRERNMADSLNSLDSSLEGGHHSFPLTFHICQTVWDLNEN